MLSLLEFLLISLHVLPKILSGHAIAQRCRICLSYSHGRLYKYLEAEARDWLSTYSLDG